MQKTTSEIQQRLVDLGYDLGRSGPARNGVDGLRGPKTDNAIVAFKRSRGLRPRPYIGPLTLKALFGEAAMEDTIGDLPWMNEAGKYLGMHEVRNRTMLQRLLRIGSTIGDPSKVPWCGDFVESVFKKTMPAEPFPGRVGQNPHGARNWMDFGVDRGPLLGAVAVFWRGRRSGWKGHVGLAAGFDPVRNNILVLGGNQSNAVTKTFLGANRLLGYRYPSTYAGERIALPHVNSSGHVLSTNEA